MQQSEHNNVEVYALPVHLLVKSQKEAKKVNRITDNERLAAGEDLKQQVWYKLTTWYKK
ncbi:MAG: hypothetical protein V4649_05395 [Bacteroidota bacterium]